jgi:hypothetical protein
VTRTFKLVGGTAGCGLQHGLFPALPRRNLNELGEVRSNLIELCPHRFLCALTYARLTVAAYGPTDRARRGRESALSPGLASIQRVPVENARLVAAMKSAANVQRIDASPHSR